MSFQLFHKQTTIDFVGKRHIAYALSAVLLVVGFIAITLNGGLRYGVDFAGGAAVQLQFAEPVKDEAIKKSFATLNLPGLAIQQYGEDGKDYLVRFSSADMTSESIRNSINIALETQFKDNKASIQRLEMVGPKVGADLRNAALEALYFAILLITVYISGRFEQRWMIAGIMAAALGAAMYLMGFFGVNMVMRVIGALALTLALCWKLKLNYALGAIVGLLHDVLITLGMLVLLGKEIDLNIIAALLTLVGYSLNDTIIIYDRIRENLRLQSDKHLDPLADIINLSVNQTLSRTIMTSATTLVAALSLVVLGGGTIHDFALTMVMGVFIGTFSTVFVSTPILLLFGDTKQYIAPARQQEAYERPGEHGIV
ncbi:MAG: protein translocase subunit SecF [Bilophila sp.]